MDSACFNSTDGFFYGVRGGRVFRLSSSTGAIIAQSGSIAIPDFQQLGLSPASVCWDSGLNRLFAVCWNTGRYDTSTSQSVRAIYRIVPSTLLVDLVIDLAATFGGLSMDVLLQTGIGVLKDIGGVLYGMGSTGTAVASVFRLPVSPPGAAVFHFNGGEYPSFAYASIGGNDRIYFNEAGAQDVGWYDFTASAHGSGALDAARNRLAIEYAPQQGNFYITEEFQFIDIYDNTGTFISQIDTTRSGFNGVNIRLNPYENLPHGMLYIAGGADNTVYTLNPNGNVLSAVKTGFDLPWDFVFSDIAHGGKKFAVQQGAVPLKEVI